MVSTAISYTERNTSASMYPMKAQTMMGRMGDER